MQSFMSTGCHYFLFMQYVQQQLYGCILLATFFLLFTTMLEQTCCPIWGFNPPVTLEIRVFIQIQFLYLTYGI